MGKAKEPYWSYVKAIIKEYPGAEKAAGKTSGAAGHRVFGSRRQRKPYCKPDPGLRHPQSAAKAAEKIRCCDRGNRKNQKASSGKCQGASPGYRFSILETVPHHRRRCSAGAVSQECSGALAGGLY